MMVVAHVVGGKGRDGRGEGVRAASPGRAAALAYVLATPLEVVLEAAVAGKLHQDAQGLGVFLFC